jgi:recombination protein RecA
LLDLAISNRRGGGLPAGRLVELNGLEGTGKSLLCAHIIANTQKKGGLPVMIDTEFASAPKFWEAVGVDLKNLIYANLVTVEEIFSNTERIIGTVRKSNKDRLVTIITDSLAAASCETELESAHGKDGYGTAKAIIISKALRKLTGLIGKQRVLAVYTNQLRMNMNAMAFGDKYVVPGGKSKDYAYSVRVRLTSTGQIKNKDKVVIGNSCKAVVTKNRMGPPRRSAEFEIHYDSGIQDLKSWIDFLKEYKLITGTAAKWTFPLQSGEVKLSTSEFVEKVNDNAEFKEEVYNIIADKYIMKYRDPNSTILEEVEISDSTDAD